ncbi:DEAD/DEAH box helicase, partial [Actinacidiphila oryziradicis]
MNRTARTNDRYSRTRTGGSAGSSGRGGFRSPAPSRSGASGRSGAPARSGGYGRRPAALQGEFALPVTLTPALPPAATFAELDLPPALLKMLTSLGMNEPFPIQGATLPNSLAGRDVLGRGRTGSGKTLAFGLALLAR